MLRSLVTAFIVLFWLLLGISILAAALMAIPETAVYMRILQLSGGAYLGLLTPLGLTVTRVSFLLTNLWWILLVAMPFVVLLRRNWIAGLTISAVAAVALDVLPPRILARQGAEMLAEARGDQPNLARPGAIRSVTIAADGCDSLCEQLLLGGDVETVRVTPGAKGQYEVEPLMFQRAPAADCAALDASFPAEAPCLLARPDDGAPSDAVLGRDTEGDLGVHRDDVGFSPRILYRETYSARDGVTGDLLATETRLIWIAPQHYVPLLANTGFDGTGISGGGLVPPQQKHEDPPLDTARLFAGLGLALAEPRGEVVLKAGKSMGVLRGYPEPQPFDVALMRSALDAGGLGSDTGVFFTSRWAARFTRHGGAPTESEIGLIQDIYAGMEPAPHELRLLAKSNPELVLGSVDQLYANLRSGDDSRSFDAINGIKRLARRQTPEENAPQAEAYLALVADDIATGALLEVAGRFPFDPVPVLQAYLAGADRTTVWPSITVFQAACRADSRWNARLVPMVHELATGLPDGRRDRDRNDALRRAFEALNVQGEAAAWEALAAALGPELVAEVRPTAFGSSRVRCR